MITIYVSETKQGLIYKTDWMSVFNSEIECESTTRKQIAHTYRIIMEKVPNANWVEINKKITDKWSSSALAYIKNLAWSGKFTENRI